MLSLMHLGGDPVWRAQVSWTSGALMIGEQEQVILVDLPKSAKKAEQRTHPRQAVSTPAELSVEEGTGSRPVKWCTKATDLILYQAVRAS